MVLGLCGRTSMLPPIYDNTHTHLRFHPPMSGREPAPPRAARPSSSSSTSSSRRPRTERLPVPEQTEPDFPIVNEGLQGLRRVEKWWFY